MREVIRLGMLHDKQTSLSQQILLQDDAGHIGQFRQGIGRIGKDKVKALLRRTMQIAKDIPTDQSQHICFQLLSHLRNEIGMGILLLHSCHLPTASRNQLKGDASRTREKIQCVRTLSVDQVRDDIKNILLGKIGRWAGTERRGYLKTPTAIYSTYDSHTNKAIRSNGAFTTSSPSK